VVQLVQPAETVILLIHLQSTVVVVVLGPILLLWAELIPETAAAMAEILPTQAVPILAVAVQVDTVATVVMAKAGDLHLKTAPVVAAVEVALATGLIQPAVEVAWEYLDKVPMVPGQVQGQAAVVALVVVAVAVQDITVHPAQAARTVVALAAGPLQATHLQVRYVSSGDQAVHSLQPIPLTNKQ
jgi:hypothetical protein